MGMAAAVAGATAVAGIGGSIYASNKASKAAGKAADAQTQAADAATAEQAREFNYVQQQNEPYRNLGLTALQAVASGYGLPVSMTGGTTGGTTPTSASGSGASMTGGYSAPAAAQASGGLTDAQAQQLLQDRPDVAAEYQRASSTADPNSPVYTQKGLDSPTNFARYWYANMGGSNSYAPASTTQTAAPATLPAAAATSTTPAGYTDPTAPNGYTMTARPAAAAAPTLNVGLDAYQQSPDYNFRLSEGQKALDHLASAGGGLMSGARAKALTQYNQDTATADYNDWRNYTTSNYNTALGQYNTEQARSDGLYQDDRNYTTGRYDTRNNQLMQLAGFGSSATASDNAAAQSYATNAGNNAMTAGNAKANGYINSANATTGAVNNLMTVGGNLAGRYIGSTAGGYGNTGGYGTQGYMSTYTGDPSTVAPY